MATNIYDARWRNAKRIAQKFNDYLDKGFLIFDEGGDIVKGRFEIRKETEFECADVILRTCPQVAFSYFIYCKELDNGMYDTIEEYNTQFDGWTIVDPSTRTKF